MNNSIYQNSKSLLKGIAKEAKRTSNDKPYIRMVINDEADSICRQIDWHAMKGTISDKQSKQYQLWLHSYAGDLHPKN
tara:strand:+ start:361 stop:594 length:234 start_codon:yes stop_codon:yes gene_type:complete